MGIKYFSFTGYETAFKAAYGDGKHSHKIAVMTAFDALSRRYACGLCTFEGMKKDFEK